MPHSINHHSIRYYEHDGEFFVLDRTTDVIPSFFRLYTGIGDPLKIPESNRYITENRLYFPILERINWGNSKSWKTAEKEMLNFLEKDYYQRYENE
jgi:hypothetical protein